MATPNLSEVSAVCAARVEANALDGMATRASEMSAIASGGVQRLSIGLLSREVVRVEGYKTQNVLGGIRRRARYWVNYRTEWVIVVE